MTTLKDLQDRKAELESLLSDVEAEIESHPEHIASFFHEHPITAKMVESLHMVRRVHGTDGIKYMYTFEGFEFVLKGSEKVHITRQCNAKHYDAFQVDGLDMAYPYTIATELREEEGQAADDMAWLDRYLKRVEREQPHIAIAYALWCKEGW